MELHAARVIDSLEGFVDVLPALIVGVGDHEAIWRPADGGWSVLDVVNHLTDEELNDFRPRLKSLLRDPSEPWSPIDPERSVEDARASLGNLSDLCECFVMERRESVEWLRALRAPDWTAVYAHPKLGPIRAGDLLLSWAAHDILHARQLLRRHHEALHACAPGFVSGYAGPLS